MAQDTLHFLGLAQQVFFLLQHFWPLTLLLAVGCVWVVTASDPGLPGGRRRLFLLGCAPAFALPLLILACGVAFAHDPEGDRPAPAYPQYLIQALLLAHLPCAALMPWWWGRRWPAVVISSVAAGYVSVFAGFISWMSVTGNWL
jgi:hypothetical protein